MVSRDDVFPIRVHDWSQLHTHLIWAYRGAPASPQAQSRVPALTAWRILRGRAIISCGDETLEVGIGNWVLLPSRNGRYEFSSNAEIISIRCDAKWPDGRNLFDLEQPLTCPASACPGLDQAAHELIAWVETQVSTAASHRLPEAPVDTPTYLRLNRHTAYWIEAYADALASYGRQPSRAGPGDCRACRLLEALNRLPLDRPPDWTALARNSHLSRKHLDRLFGQHLGTTSRKYFNARRVQFAKQALGSLTYSIKEIAHLVGFAQSASFSHWFRQHVGTTAQRYRQSKNHNEMSNSPKPSAS